MTPDPDYEHRGKSYISKEYLVNSKSVKTYIFLDLFFLLLQPTRQIARLHAKIMASINNEE